MTAKFNITGSIEINLPEEIIEKFNSAKSEVMKKHVLELYFHNALWGCGLAGKNELDYDVDFNNVYIERDWDKYPGTICGLDINELGCPLAIWVDDYPTTNKEIIDNTIKEIANRKGRR